MTNKVILPVRLDSYAGDTSALEAHLFNDKEEYGGKSVPDDSMWAAVYILDGKIDHSMTEYGYRSLEELLDTHKKEKIMGIKENRKDAELERARDIAEDALEILLTKDSVLLHVEGELNLAPGAIKKAYRTLQKARTGRVKKTGIDKDEVFYWLSVEDILIQAKEMRIPRKKLTPEIINQIERKIEDSMGTGNDMIQDAISEVISEKKDAYKLKEEDWAALEDKSASDVDETKKRLGIGGADPMNLEEIRNNPAIMMHLRFDLTPGEVLKPTGTKTETELKEQAGFFFCIHIHNNSPRLVLVHLLPDGWGSPDYISDFPDIQYMLRDAVRDAGDDHIGGFYPINKPIADLLQMGLRIAGKKRRS